MKKMSDIDLQNKLVWVDYPSVASENKSVGQTLELLEVEEESIWDTLIRDDYARDPGLLYGLYYSDYQIGRVFSRRAEINLYVLTLRVLLDITENNLQEINWDFDLDWKGLLKKFRRHFPYLWKSEWVVQNFFPPNSNDEKKMWTEGVAREAIRMIGKYARSKHKIHEEDEFDLARHRRKVWK